MLAKCLERVERGVKVWPKQWIDDEFVLIFATKYPKVVLNNGCYLDRGDEDESIKFFG